MLDIYSRDLVSDRKKDVHFTSRMAVTLTRFTEVSNLHLSVYIQYSIKNQSLNEYKF